MPEKTNLVGNDGYFGTVSYGAELIGDAVKTFDVLAGGGAGKGTGFYEVTAKATVGSIFAVLNVGEMYFNDGLAVMATGDKSKKITINRQIDVGGWKLDISADEIRVDPLNSTFKLYRRGKSDASGSLSGGMIIPHSLAIGGMVNKFIKKVKFGANNAVTVAEVDKSPLMFVGYLQSDTSSGETEVFVAAKIELFGFNLGIEDGNKQAYDSKFRLKTDLVQYEREIA